MKRSDDPDRRVADYWSRQYQKNEREYAERDVERENALTRGLHRSTSENRSDPSRNSGRSTEKRSQAEDLQAMRELKTKLLADISACEYLRPSLRARWYERLAEIGLTAADAESALTALSEEILDYRAEYPFDLTGLGQYGQAQILRSDLVGLSSVLVVLSAQCMNYQFNYCSQRERASGLDIPVVHRESHQASQGATLEPSSGVVSECVHCKRSTHLSEQSGRTWCGWCSTWASLS